MRRPWTSLAIRSAKTHGGPVVGVESAVSPHPLPAGRGPRGAFGAASGQTRAPPATPHTKRRPARPRTKLHPAERGLGGGVDECEPPGCRAGAARRTRMDQDGVDERAGRSQAHVCEKELQKITSEKTAAFTLTHLTFTLGLESCNPPRRT